MARASAHDRYAGFIGVIPKDAMEIFYPKRARTPEGSVKRHAKDTVTTTRMLRLALVTGAFNVYQRWHGAMNAVGKARADATSVNRETEWARSIVDGIASPGSARPRT
jgi:DMSO/TMAO reductase YedYZ molybdopterin-dependent catalytic subunit